MVELEAHRSRSQSFEYPCLQEVVVDRESDKLVQSLLSL